MVAGTKVYLNWYDFTNKTEYVCKGEVVDNSLWDGTKWQGYVNVLFRPPHSAGSFCHHFPEDKLSLTLDNVPHDDCYLVCAKKSRVYEHDHTVKPHASSPSDAWQQVQQFKQNHWDYQHGHISVDALDEYYAMWRDAIAAKRGMMVQKTELKKMEMEYPATPEEAMMPIKRIVSDEKMEEIKTKLKESFKKPTAKELRSTGAITFIDSIQTSFLD